MRDLIRNVVFQYREHAASHRQAAVEDHVLDEYERLEVCWLRSLNSLLIAVDSQENRIDEIAKCCQSRTSADDDTIALNGPKS